MLSCHQWTAMNQAPIMEQPSIEPTMVNPTPVMEQPSIEPTIMNQSAPVTLNSINQSAVASYGSATDSDSNITTSDGAQPFDISSMFANNK